MQRNFSDANILNSEIFLTGKVQNDDPAQAMNTTKEDIQTRQIIFFPVLIQYYAIQLQFDAEYLEKMHCAGDTSVC